MKFCVGKYFENLSRHFKVNLNLTRITGTLHEDLCTFVVVSFGIILRMRNVADKSCRENQNTFYIWETFFRKSCLLWDTVEKYGRAPLVTDENMIRRVRFARWITKVTDASSEDVILIAFPWKFVTRTRLNIKLCVHCLSY